MAIQTGRLTDDRAWEIVSAAGFSQTDVDAFARYRAARAHDELVANAQALRDACDLVTARGLAGLVVPDPSRHGKGAKLTETDIAGAFRVTGALIAQADSRAAAAWDQAGDPSRALHALARYEHAGQHDSAAYLVAAARDRARAEGDSSGK